MLADMESWLLALLFLAAAMGDWEIVVMVGEARKEDWPMECDGANAALVDRETATAATRAATRMNMISPTIG
jgi:hypothetical protein